MTQKQGRQEMDWFKRFTVLLDEYVTHLMEHFYSMTFGFKIEYIESGHTTHNKKDTIYIPKKYLKMNADPIILHEKVEEYFLNEGEDINIAHGVALAIEKAYVEKKLGQDWAKYRESLGLPLH